MKATRMGLGCRLLPRLCGAFLMHPALPLKRGRLNPLRHSHQRALVLQLHTARAACVGTLFWRTAAGAGSLATGARLHEGHPAAAAALAWDWS